VNHPVDPVAGDQSAGDRPVRDLHHLAAAYALDALEPDERAAFEAHYPTCAVCDVDVLAFREMLGRVAESTPVAPPADLRARVLAEIATTRQLSPRVPGVSTDEVDELSARRDRTRPGRWTTGLLAVAAALLLVIAAGVLVVGRSSDGFDEQLAAVVTEPDGRLVALAGEGPGSVRVAWSDTSGRAFLVADGLPTAPAGSAYELWLIDAGGPVPMRVLDPATDGTLRVEVDLTGTPVAWGVTLEPVVGSDAPTGEILYVAEV
jgi:anti-sigma-K factor RskA